MGYLIYLASIIICIIYGGIRMDRIGNFIDLTSFEFVVLPCILVLICTDHGKDFLNAFVCLFHKEKYSEEKAKDGAEAVKLVCISSLIFGGLGVVISSINVLKGLDLAALHPGIVAFDVSVALVSIFYALVINAVLAPLYFMLKYLKIRKKVKKTIILEAGKWKEDEDAG